MVLLAGDLAYKMKKPVDLGYLDFGTPAKRKSALARELELNARTAPTTYLRLVPVAEKDGHLSLGGDGDIVEWLLEMRRFRDGALLAQVADRGELTEAMVEQLAVHAAQFHDGTPVSPGYDWASAVARIARENTADLKSQAPTFAHHDLAAAIAAREWHRKRYTVALAQQSNDVRHCHGDMHLGNAFLDHGAPTLFDCIEFDDFYAMIPPLYDIAFLLMDLIARGLRRHANRALNTWAVHRAPELWQPIVESLAVLPLYLALRAEIRAKTEARRPAGQTSAGRYLALASTLLERHPPRLIAIGGLSGTGKSSLAKAIAWRIGGGAGAIHLRSDEIRKRLAGIAPDRPLPAGAYTKEASDRIYAELLALARSALDAGASVVVDAVFARDSERAAFLALGKAAGIPFIGLWLDAPSNVLEQRIGQRRGDASDADATVLKKQLTYDLGEIAWARIDTRRSPAEVERDALERIGSS
jgi:aminoglycoside phosphotransferase family enzyme/predicted kinase